MAEKREGMSKEDVYKKLCVLKNDNAKISYLQRVIRKKGLMISETRNSVFDSLIELFEKKGKWKDAAELCEKAGKPDKAAEAYAHLAEKYEKISKFEDAAMYWDMAKKPDKAAKAYEKFGLFFKAGEAYESLGQSDKAAEAYTSQAKQLEKHDLFKTAAEFWEKAAKLWEKSGKPNKAAEARQHCARK